MARNDEAKQQRMAVAAQARAAQLEVRLAAQDAMREARQTIETAKAEARATQEQARRELQAAVLDARDAQRGRGPDQRGGERRSRRGRAPLSREVIVDVAMKQMASKGLDRLTMRSIASELDTGPASLYVHVRSTAELHGLMLDRILADLNLEGKGETWRERIASILGQYYELLMDHPEFARSALSVRPRGHHSLAVVERLLALLDEGGIPSGQAAWGLDLLLLWVTAGAAEHAADGAEPTDQTDVPGWDMLRMGLSTPDAYPHVARIGLDLVSGTGSQRSQWAIEALLTGISGTPRA